MVLAGGKLVLYGGDFMCTPNICCLLCLLLVLRADRRVRCRPGMPGVHSTGLRCARPVTKMFIQL